MIDFLFALLNLHDIIIVCLKYTKTLLNCRFFMRQIRLNIFLFLFAVLYFTAVQASDQVWLLVDTTKLTLEVKQENKTLVTMNNIAIGQKGAGFKKHTGDDITPKGVYKIGWVNNKSRFYKFYGFNYPSVDNANEALLSGLLSKRAHTAIVTAHKKNKVPPQNTKIGGQIGIHGLGEADKNIHKIMNWTHGCIALSNEQVDQLGQWIKKGTRVKVK